MTPELQLNLIKAREVADKIRAVWPEKAALIDKLVAECESGKRDRLTVQGSIHLKLEKFDGEYSPDKTPVEVVQTRDEL